MTDLMPKLNPYLDLPQPEDTAEQKDRWLRESCLEQAVKHHNGMGTAKDVLWTAEIFFIWTKEGKI